MAGKNSGQAHDSNIDYIRGFLHGRMGVEPAKILSIEKDDRVSTNEYKITLVKDCVVFLNKFEDVKCIYISGTTISMDIDAGDKTLELWISFKEGA